MDNDPETDSGDDNHYRDYVDHLSWSQLISFRLDPGQPGWLSASYTISSPTYLLHSLFRPITLSQIKSELIN